MTKPSLFNSRRTLPTCLVIASLGLLTGALLLKPARAAETAAPAHPTNFAPIQTFLQKYCVECHGEKVAKSDLTLHVYKTADLVLKDRKIWEDVIDRVEGGEMPPKKKARPAEADQAAFLASVKAIFEYADATAKPDPGHVTVRRLNRTEYNNTIRDLIGVDFEPAEDFPSDDIGHGFDNMGDVLSISPILMERYLAAAETIMQRAIIVDPPKPPPHRQSAKNLEPAGRNVPQTRFRPLTRGNLNTPFRLGLDGAYVLRTRVFGLNGGTEGVKAAWTVDGKQIATIDVPATATEKAPATFEQPLNLEAGEHRFAITLLNPTEIDPKKVEAEMKKAAAAENKPVKPADGKPGDVKDVKPVDPKDVKKPEPDPKRTINVEFIELTGPSDPRPMTQRRLLAADPKLSPKDQTREILARFLSKAYRRTPTPVEVNRLVKLVDQAVLRGEKRDAGIQLAMQAALVSPKFLFRVELDDRPDSADPHAIDEFQLASRLSYFIWSSMPDDELFELAGKKQLTANLDAQVKRMLKDPKAQSLVDNFAMQWLQLKRLKSFSPDTRMFPAFDDRLRQSMQKETELFFAAVMKEDRSILDLIDADFTFLDRNLAQLYGIADTAGNRVGQKTVRPGGKQFNRGEFARVSLADRQRGGILTQASVLTVTSNPTRTSPVKRGRFILDQILGTPPPPDVPQLSEDKQATLSGSLRQRMEQHRANPACAQCHARMDPIGFAFENFDAIGAFREKDGGFVIDPSGTLTDGTSFSGVEQLKTMLKEKKRLFARCLTEKMLTYALGRGVEYYDKRAVNSICNALDKNDYKFSTLVIEITKSDPFRLRRGKEPR